MTLNGGHYNTYHSVTDSARLYKIKDFPDMVTKMTDLTGLTSTGTWDVKHMVWPKNMKPLKHFLFLFDKTIEDMIYMNV